MRRAVMAALLCVSGLAGPAAAQTSEPLVVLVPTGTRQDGLPVMTRLADPSTHLAVLGRGYSGELLRLYAAVQRYLHQVEGRTPEPAYLALTSENGGFPRTGLVIDGVAKPTAGWVDLQATGTLSGRFGAMDQIFPHELWHVIHLQLVGQPYRGRSRQVHALGVRTDPSMAFAEGMAEHAQVLAIDHPDAPPDTAALPNQADRRARAETALSRYERDLQRRFWPMAPQQLRFLLWFSATEQVQRYFHVKDNRFGRTPQVPVALLDARDLHTAWLLSSVLPPPVDAPPRPGAVQWSIDGPVAHFFWRLATDEALLARPPSPELVTLFGLDPTAVSPRDGVYLRLFRVLHLDKPSTTAELVEAWQRRFPDEAGDVRRIAQAALLGQAIPSAPEVWVDGAALTLGTSLFDQYRGVPRMHNFDANAASELDWLAVPGVDRTKAHALLDGAPYASLQDLVRRSGIPAEVLVRPEAEASPGAEGLSLTNVITPYLWRLFAFTVLAACFAVALQRVFGEPWRWSIARGFFASLLTLTSGLVLTAAPWMFLAIPVVCCGVPGWLIRGLRGRGWTPRTVGIWLLAAIPAFVLTF